MDLQYHIYGNITSQYSIYGNIIDLFDSPTIFPTISSLESVKKCWTALRQQRLRALCVSCVSWAMAAKDPLCPAPRQSLRRGKGDGSDWVSSKYIYIQYIVFILNRCFMVMCILSKYT